MIRKATIADLPALGPMAREFYANSQFLQGFDLDRFVALWQQLLTNGTGAIFLLEDAGEIVGTIGGVVYPEPYSSALIATEFFWYVLDGHRGGGMALYREFEAWAEFNECAQIRMVHLHDSMPEKLGRLYRRLGFVSAETHYVKPLQQRGKAA